MFIMNSIWIPYLLLSIMFLALNCHEGMTLNPFSGAQNLSL